MPAKTTTRKKPGEWRINKPRPASNYGLSAEDRKAFALWAADCAEHVLNYFEKKRPRDDRPRTAIVGAREWARTGVFHMKDVRKASLDAHAAARETDGAARFAARAAGQAVATAHAPGHAIAAAYYAVKAGGEAELRWQKKKLPRRLRKLVTLTL